MFHAAFLDRKRLGAGPSGAANPAVRRYPTRRTPPGAPGFPMPEFPMPEFPMDGDYNAPIPMMLGTGAHPAMKVSTMNGAVPCAF